MKGYSWLFAFGVVLLALFLPVYSYLALIYRELGRMTTGPVHEHLDIFEAEIEPKIRLEPAQRWPCVPHSRTFLAGVSGSRNHARRRIFSFPAPGNRWLNWPPSSSSKS